MRLRRFIAFSVPALLLMAASQAQDHVFKQEDRAWWAIQPVTNPVPPADGHPVDAFIDLKRSEAGLSGSSKAGAEEFIRRATFDLHGLPPSSEQVKKFAAAWAMDEEAAIAALIDELLASPRYGERWAQHWLDVVRYAESDGYREDAFRPEAYRYRDYVIRSLNDDKPYDQFVREQLAADEFAAQEPDKLIATAFLRLGVYEWNQRNALMQRELMLNEITNVTGEVFMGVGIGCAQCHDHKFDPLLQRDYFALQAFLSSTTWPSDRVLGNAEQLKAHTAWEQKTQAIRSEMDAMLSKARHYTTEKAVTMFPEDVQAMYRKPAAERTSYEQQISMLVQRQVDREIGNIKAEGVIKKEKGDFARYQELEAELAKLKSEKPNLPVAFISTDTGSAPAVTSMGVGKMKREVDPGFLALLNPEKPDITPTEHTTGRRSALAKWITHAENPFTSRVIVNRIWQHHFHTGLVATPNDFGTLGEPPSHPELLDWLATAFVEGGWKMKPLHRLIMTSATYRQTARREPGKKESITDPYNVLLWRFPPARLSAEQVRDAMLSVSGELRQRDNGGPSADGSVPVRSVFVKKMRNTPDDILHAFDVPVGFDSAPDRQMTTTPTQALLLANNPWPMQRAAAFAKRILDGQKEVSAEQVTNAFHSAWSRDPDKDEISAALDFIAAQKSDFKPAPPPAPTDNFPGETGLRPIAQNFSKVTGIELGDKALWLQPGSRFERLHLKDTQLDSDTFTIDAVVQLDAIQKDASVNTLISRWNGNQNTSGWSLGVTSEKSSYKPRSLILQLTGANPGGDIEYEVVASNIFVPLGHPFSVRVSISDRKATFELRDLSAPDSEPEKADVAHNIVGLIQDPKACLLIGGRDEKLNAHLWDGQVARVSITDTFDVTFNGDNETSPVPGSEWMTPPRPEAPKSNPALSAFTDFCHALLSSNEFLYLH